ncbi:MAG: FAD-binding and (Fe-S)-binding domain-containing protein [Acidothermaceae bacterium]
MTAIREHADVRIEPEDRNPAQPSYAGALAKDLRKAIKGEVRFDAGSRALYAYDGSIYRQLPVGVVLPKDADDVVAALAVCRQYRAPVFGRGCGTGVAGQTVNSGIVFDFSKYMQGIELDIGGSRARVLPGTICDSLRDAAGEHGLTFGPDPATHDHCTLGGMIGNNSCGTHSITAGKTADNVESLDIVTYDGTRMTVGATSEDELERIVAAGGRRGEIYAGLKRIRDAYADAIRGGMPHIPRRVSGYNLDELLPENGFNVARALVGTESTCALTLSADVRLVANPPKRALVVLGYRDIPSAGHDASWIMSFKPIGLEFTSVHCRDNLRTKGFEVAEELLPQGKSWLLAEFGGDTQQEADDRAGNLISALGMRDDGPSHKLYDDPEEETAVWELRRHSAGSARMPAGLGGHGGWTNWEDAAVPPERLGDYLEEFLQLLDKHGYDGVFYGHWGQGCVHCRIDWDLRTVDGIMNFRRFMEEAADLVVSYGGSLSGEHGDGHGRAELWPRMFSPELMKAFTEFKQLWDPDALLNPHKLIDPYLMHEHLREGTSWHPIELETVFSYPQDAGSFAEAAGRCYGVGKCRHVQGGTMCPSFMVTGEEMHSTRGRAHLLQEMAEASGPVDGRWRNDDVKEALDLCLACKGCKGDCPVKVDMATYKAEFLHHYFKGRLRPRAAYSMGLIPIWARLAGRVPHLANAMTQTPGVSHLLKIAGGVSLHRKVPKFASVPFTTWFEHHQPRYPQGPPVLLWADTFTNYFHPEVARAGVEVLESAGFNVQVSKASLCCGRPFYDYGMLTLAKAYLRRILDDLRPQIVGGIPVVGLEPSCLAVFRDELPNLFPHDEDAKRLQQQSYLLSEFIAEKAPEWNVPRLHRKALVQAHCHHQAVMGFRKEKELLDKMELDVENPDSGCCGMAGSFGFESGEHYDVSTKAGERVILPKVRQATKDTIVMADGFSCREQIEQGTGRRALHLAQVIQLAIREGIEGPRGREPERSLQKLVANESTDHAHRGLLVGASVVIATAGAAVVRKAASPRGRISARGH